MSGEKAARKPTGGWIAAKFALDTWEREIPMRLQDWANLKFPKSILKDRKASNEASAKDAASPKEVEAWIKIGRAKASFSSKARPSSEDNTPPWAPLMARSTVALA